MQVFTNVTFKPWTLSCLSLVDMGRGPVDPAVCQILQYVVGHWQIQEGWEIKPCPIDGFKGGVHQTRWHKNKWENSCVTKIMAACHSLNCWGINGFNPSPSS